MLPGGWAVSIAGEPIDESCRKPTTASLAAAATSGLAAAGWRLRRWSRDRVLAMSSNFSQ
jgi:hypothetical protein